MAATSAELFAQCLLIRASPGGQERVVNWLPRRFAKVGMVVRLKIGGAWDPGWTVAEVWSVATEEQIDYMDSPLRRHRRIRDPARGSCYYA